MKPRLVALDRNIDTNTQNGIDYDSKNPVLMSSNVNDIKENNDFFCHFYRYDWGVKNISRASCSYENTCIQKLNFLQPCTR